MLSFLGTASPAVVPGIEPVPVLKLGPRLSPAEEVMVPAVFLMKRPEGKKNCHPGFSGRSGTSCGTTSDSLLTRSYWHSGQFNLFPNWSQPFLAEVQVGFVEQRPAIISKTWLFLKMSFVISDKWFFLEISL